MARLPSKKKALRALRQTDTKERLLALGGEGWTARDGAALSIPIYQYSIGMVLKFKCRDIGFDCGFVAKGSTEEEILAQCAAHADKDHHMKSDEINEELRTKIRKNTHKSWF